jgi:hypothetical protein
VLREAAKTKQQTRGPVLPQSFDMTLSPGKKEKRKKENSISNCYLCM